MGANSDLAAKLFAAMVAGDEGTVRALCAPGLRFSQNGGAAVGLDALLGLSSTVRSAVPDYRYEKPVRSDTADGFVEEHDFAGTLPDGTQCAIPVCLVATVEAGRVVSVREYFDTAAAAPLFKALGG